MNTVHGQFKTFCGNTDVTVHSFDEIKEFFLKVNPEVPNFRLIYLICTPKFLYKMLISINMTTVISKYFGSLIFMESFA